MMLRQYGQVYKILPHSSRTCRFRAIRDLYVFWHSQQVWKPETEGRKPSWITVLIHVATINNALAPTKAFSIDISILRARYTSNFFCAVPGSSLSSWNPAKSFGRSETESAFNHLLVAFWKNILRRKQRWHWSWSILKETAMIDKNFTLKEINNYNILQKNIIKKFFKVVKRLAHQNKIYIAVIIE